MLPGRLYIADYGPTDAAPTSSLLLSLGWWHEWLEAPTRMPLGGVSSCDGVPVSRPLVSALNKNPLQQKSYCNSGLSSISYWVLCCCHHTHHATTLLSPHRQQQEGCSAPAQDVLCSCGPHNGNSMAIPLHIVLSHIVRPQVEVMKGLLLLIDRQAILAIRYLFYQYRPAILLYSTSSYTHMMH